MLGAWDALTGLPDWVTDEYDVAEKTFGDEVCTLITDISTQVNGVIATCEAIIEKARKDIDKLFSDLPEDLKEWAAQEQATFNKRLNGLQNEVSEAQQDFNRELTQRAAQSVQDVRQEVHALREAAKGLIGKIADAISDFVEDPVKFIIDGLLELVGISPPAFWAVVKKIGEAIERIADDPLSFAENLLKAIGDGFQRFFDNIAGHLLDGLLEWLFSGLGSVGVEIPSDFSLKSVITFFLQLMGISWARIRKLLAKHIGEENVALIEKAFEIVSTLIEMGPEGIFEMIKEQLNPKNILDMVLEAAVDYMIEALIKAVSVRIALLFNPVGAIAQAIEAIYRVLKWIFQNAARIFSLIETVVNGITDILNGNTAGMAKAVEGALAKLISPVIDFLADYIGLGGLPDAIADLIRGLQDWIEGILDRVIGFLVKQAKALLSALGVGEKDKGKKSSDGDSLIQSEEESLTMAGASHTLYIVFSPEPRIELASNRELLSYKINQVRIQINQRIAKLETEFAESEGSELAEQIEGLERQSDDLGNLSGAAEFLENQAEQELAKMSPEERLNSGAGVTKGFNLIPSIRTGFDALARAIQEYGKRYNVQDIEQLFDQALGTPPHSAIAELVDKASHIPPRSYDGGKHWKGTSEEERRISSNEKGAGQFLHSMTAADVEKLERTTLLEGDLRDKGGGTYHAYMEHGEVVGYANGKKTKWLRAELTGAAENPEIHSHPRPGKR